MFRGLSKFLRFNWWVVLFVTLCVVSFTHSWKKKRSLYDSLYDRYLELLAVKEAALREQQELTMQINSQSDPAWVELVLMRCLGLVPEGQKKILFRDE